MFNHEPVGYRCPFCLVAAGGEDQLTSRDDVVLESSQAFAFVSSRWWPNNHGHVLVAPRTHHENLYDLPAADGYQDAWHLHVHVFPRYADDNLYNTRPLATPATPNERAPYSHKLRRYFADAKS
ncbi:histidine triad (HIT) family protein [Kribbella voronezhensis]|uniref:Histidine triad (HIT) family protein n=1 Tax=Kribbella voronezhensis TaxID=2512212 RepID=A0A4R7TI91_9ACTN|nr:HIT family protein [Kribbella voronezhensis]TDU91639.1 histidine triad (HIT) family protein [Kribbella voronezhensis]